jgi:hypothetical protein
LFLGENLVKIFRASPPVGPLSHLCRVPCVTVNMLSKIDIIDILPSKYQFSEVFFASKVFEKKVSTN